MQITLPINQQTQPCEASAIQPSEKIDKSPASSFWVQIDQILNANDGSDLNPAGEKPAENLTASTLSNPLNLRLHVSTHSAGSIKTRTAPASNTPDSTSPEIQNDHDADAQTVALNGAVNPISEGQLSVVAMSEATSKSASVSGEKFVESLPNVAEPSVDSASDAPDSSADGQCSPQYFAAAGQPAVMVSASRWETPARSKSKVEDKGFALKDPQSKLNETQLNTISQSMLPELFNESVLTSGSKAAPGNASLFGTPVPIEKSSTDGPFHKTQSNVYAPFEENYLQSKPVGAPLDAFGFQTELPGSSKQPDLQSGSGSVHPTTDLTSKPGISQDVTPQIEGSSPAIPFLKTQDTSYAPFEEKNSQNRPVGAPLDAFGFQAEFPGSSKQSDLQSGSGSVIPTPELTSKPGMLRGVTPQIENSSPAIPFLKTQEAFYSPFEENYLQNRPVGAPLDAVGFQAEFPGSSKQSDLQSGSGSVLPTLELTSKPGMSWEVTPQIENSSPAIAFLKIPDISYAPFEETNPLSRQRNIPLDAINSKTAPLEFPSPSVLQSGLNITPQQAVPSAKSGISPDANPQIEKSLAADPLPKAQHIAYSPYERKNPQSSPAGIPFDALISQTKFSEPSAGTTPQLKLNATVEKIGMAGNPGIPQDVNTNIENSPAAGSIHKAQDTVVAALENMSFGESRTDQDAPHNAPSPAMVVQGKPENAQQNSGKTSAMAPENAQAFFSVSQHPNTFRGEGSNNIIGSGSAPVTTAQPQEFVLQVAQRIQFQIRDGKETVRIQLKPDSLGRIEIRAETMGNGVIARIATESNSVKNYLENNMSILQQTLQDQGLKVDRIHIVVQDGLGFSSFSGYGAQFGHAGSGNTSDESQGSAELSGSMMADPLEEISLDPMTWDSLNPNIHFHTVA
jgi:flagellar hook-length control protein FliK